MKCWCLESWSLLLTRSSGHRHCRGAGSASRRGTVGPTGLPGLTLLQTHLLCFWKTILDSFSQQPPRLPRIHCTEKGLFLSKRLILMCSHPTTSSGTGKSVPWHLDGCWVRGLGWILIPWLTEGEGGSDSPYGSFPWNFIGESWLSIHIWGVERKNISQGSQEQKQGKRGNSLCPRELYSLAQWFSKCGPGTPPQSPRTLSGAHESKLFS